MTMGNRVHIVASNCLGSTGQDAVGGMTEDRLLACAPAMQEANIASDRRPRQAKPRPNGGIGAMASLWDDVKNAIVDSYVYAADKAEEITQIGRAKAEIFRLNRQIAHTMSEIGGRAFELFEAGDESAIASDADVAKAVEKIRALRRDIEKWDAEIQAAKAKAEREKEASEG